MSNSPAPFDYLSLQPEVAETARQSADAIREHGRRAAESIIAIGEELLRVKEALPHGAWLPWLEVEFGWSDQTARNFIRAADFAKSKTILNLEPFDLRALYVLSAPSTPPAVQAEALSLARSGERVTHAAVKGLIADRQVVEAKGSVVLRDAVDAGEVRLPDAREIARLPKAVQREVVEDIRAGAPAATAHERIAREVHRLVGPNPAGCPGLESAEPSEAGGEADDEPPLPLDLPAVEILPPLADGEAALPLDPLLGVTEMVVPAADFPDADVLPPAALDTPGAAPRTPAQAGVRDLINVFMTGIYGSYDNFRRSVSLGTALDMRDIKFTPDEMVAALPRDDLRDHLEKAQALAGFVARVIDLIKERIDGEEQHS